MARAPHVAERLYGAGIGPWIAWGLAWISSVFPFALVEWLLVAWIGARLVLALRGLRAVQRGTRRLRNALGAGVLATLGDLGLAAALFYALWGLGYARPPVEDRIALAVDPAVAPARVAHWATELIAATNDAYRALHDSDDIGSPTATDSETQLEKGVEEGWQRLAAELGFGSPLALRYPRTKRLLISPLLHRAGLSGVYCPFTGEANINRTVPAAYRAHTIAHEKAHQRGIHPEDDANFLGFLAGARAEDPLARYAAMLFGQRQLLHALLRRGESALVEEILPDRLAGVQRDVDDLNAYWRQHRGRTQRIAEKMNDAYLKTNRVEGGVLAYGRSVELILAWLDADGEVTNP